MALRLLLILFGVQLGFSQVTTSETPQETVNDTLIDGHTRIVQSVEPVVDSTAQKQLLDNALAAEFDKKWRSELYNIALYDTIYKSVSELDISLFITQNYQQIR